MAKRGTELREHILSTAKDVFLEVGFERTSMDGVAARAGTSKRTLYAHFESKERLFLAVIELVRGLFLARLRSPGDYGDDPAEALALFCARYLEGMLYGPSLQMVRMSLAETDRFPEQAARYFDVLFAEVHARLAGYLAQALGLAAEAADGAARRLLGRVLYPLWPRALFGLHPSVAAFDPEAPSRLVDPDAIRLAVGETLAALPGRSGAA